MTMRRMIAAASAAATVVLGAVVALLMEQLDAGWGWWVAFGAAVILSAALAGWLALRQQPVLLGVGGVRAQRDIKNSVSTRVTGLPADADTAGGAGAVEAGRDIDGEVTTRVDFAPPAGDQDR
ncbi:hypothetical protein QQM39_31810 [Streptomyces sp. DT2A-34]|uniref:hypothetical protein n=1 Tax=Streptomyces sp. DT2A-34 TaxID=3051182 RepID=UPI00265C43A2|nr:hypothetical protein [Streptomyces sp. DT2A-34]MDO0915242.1 hypothetical protein [Streptomyces sp. DT2A-34]